MNSAKLQEVFSFGTRYGETCAEFIEILACEIEQGAVRVVCEQVPKCAVVETDLDMFSGRTMGHKIICTRIASWLKQRALQGSRAPKDLGYAGGVADIAVGDALFVECGYTKASKILAGLFENQSVIVSPYGDDAYTFSRAGHMRRYAQYKAQQQEAMRNAVRVLDIPKT